MCLVQQVRTLEAEVTRLAQEIQRGHQRVAALEALLLRIQLSLDFYIDDRFLLEGADGQTIQQAIAAVLDRPEARGERPLLEGGGDL